MRQKELKVLFTFPTTTAAMAMEDLCRREGLPGRLIPVPRSITADCGMAWSAPAAERRRLEQAAAERGLPLSAVYELLL